MSKNTSDDTTHHLIQFYEPPNSLVELRKELMYHPDITDYAQHGNNFEDCMGRIALKLDIALDGEYDCDKLCAVLVEALRNKRMYPNHPHLRATGLVDAELIEREGTLELVERDREVTTIVPEDSIIIETVQDTRQISLQLPDAVTAGTVGDQDTSTGETEPATATSGSELQSNSEAVAGSGKSTEQAILIYNFDTLEYERDVVQFWEDV